MPTSRTISLIGMPGAGKSTVGVLLAKLLGLSFVDTDLIIQTRAHATLHELLKAEGYLALRQREQQVLLDIPLDDTLVSTGGSAVYSEPGMRRLGEAGPLVFLDVNLEILATRVDNQDSRGIARPPGQDFAGVFAERRPLYARYADLTIEASDLTPENCARLIAAELAQQLP
jgi:shikimate kinase